MEAQDITEAVTQAGGVLISFFAQYVAYVVAKGLAAESKRSKFEVYLRAVGASALLGFTAWGIGGPPIHAADPLFGGLTEEVEFTPPTDAQRNRYGVTAFTVVSTLIITGAFFGLRDREARAPTNRAQLTLLTVGESTPDDLHNCLEDKKVSFKEGRIENGKKSEVWELRGGGNMDTAAFLLWGQVAYDKDQSILFRFEDGRLVSYESLVHPDK
jgi:hypothetical protein